MGNEEFNEKRECVVGIDIGSSSVTMSVGYKTNDNLLDIKGVDIQKVGDSVKEGTITHVMDLGNAISEAKRSLEKELNVTLRDAFVGISGADVYCAGYVDFVYVSSANGLISETDVQDLTTRINKVSPNSEYEIVDRILQRYIVDDKQEVRNPIGAVGSKLSAEYLLVLCHKRQLDRVKQTLFQAELSARNIYVNPIVQPLALLSKEEMEEGVAIVDIGSDLTDISVVLHGHVCFFASLPIGSSSINNDLSQFISATKLNIEKMKKTYGNAIAEKVSPTATCRVEVLGKSYKQILQRNIAEIIEERLKDIARFTLRCLRDAKVSSKIPCGIVLTGGPTYLSNIDELFAREMKMSVRCATTLYGITEESREMLLPQVQSATLGVMLSGIQHSSCTIDKLSTPIVLSSNDTAKKEGDGNTGVIETIHGGISLGEEDDDINDGDINNGGDTDDGDDIDTGDEGGNDVDIPEKPKALERFRYRFKSAWEKLLRGNGDQNEDPEIDNDNEDNGYLL